MISLIDLYRKLIPEKIRKTIYRKINAYVKQQIRIGANNKVVSGPFQGMRMDLDEVYVSALLGILEKEIYPVFTQLSALRFEQIINLGASEGYYAVGMALKWPQATVYAFDALEKFYRPQIEKLARDNSVSERVIIRGYCVPADLDDLLRSDKLTLLMLDVEGDELKLLDPVVITGLRRTVVLVELHPMFAPGCAKIIEERFDKTHDITKYITGSRSLKDFPLRSWKLVNPLMKSFVEAAIWERPAPQEYFLMVPKGQ